MPAPVTKPPSFTPSSAFVLRTPVLPWDAIESWCDGVSGAGRDAIAILRARLAALVSRPVVDQALRVASPGFHASLGAWRERPDSDQGRSIEAALVRYIARMATRPEPFGLFAGVGPGAVTATTNLAVPPLTAQRRCSRLDNEIVDAVARSVTGDPAHGQALVYRPSPTVVERGGWLRYSVPVPQPIDRCFAPASVRATPMIRATLERAANGARLDALAHAIVGEHPATPFAAAMRFVAGLAERQLLVPDLGLVVTGGDPVDTLIEQLTDAGAAPAATRLAEVRAALAEVDAAGPAPPAPPDDRLARALDDLGVDVQTTAPIQVVLVRPACGVTLGAPIVREVERAMRALAALDGRRHDPLADLKQAFRERYQDREVPLLDALDETTGIGAALTSGPDGVAGSEPTVTPWGPRERHLQRRVMAAVMAGEREIVLRDDDQAAMRHPTPRRLPDAWTAHVRLAATSGAAADRGDFVIHLSAGLGPSGARTLGRFCHESPEIDAMVREHLRAEEALRPDAVFAEVVHLPVARAANIVCRPVLRSYEIPCLSRGGAPSDRQLPLSDLVVSVAHDRVLVRSRRLGCEVVPRVTSAMAADPRHPAVYRFLCAVQDQDGDGAVWSWGAALDSMPFLPRVRIGRAIVSCARWRLGCSDGDALIAAVASGDLDETFRAVQAVRLRLGLPRFSVIDKITLDLDNALCASVFASMVASALAREPDVAVEEPFPGPDQLCASGPEGRYVHEAVVLFARTADRAESARARRAPATASPGPDVARLLAPGSTCLYAKLYGAPADLDRILVRAVAPLARRARADGTVSHWFFVRYGDPHPHLRVRFFGDPGALAGRLLPALRTVTEPLLADSSMWRLQIDTYDRELERYGGPAAIDLIERLFWIDSESVVDVIDALDGRHDDVRWLIGLRGAEGWLTDLDLPPDARAAQWTVLRDDMAAEIRADTAFRRSVGATYRAWKGDLERVLAAPGHGAATTRLAPTSAEALARCLAAVDRRTAASTEVVTALQALDDAGRLAPRLRHIAISIVHMHINRVLPAVTRHQELAMYDVLRRWHAERRARQSERRHAPTRGSRADLAPGAAALDLGRVS